MQGDTFTNAYLDAIMRAQALVGRLGGTRNFRTQDLVTPIAIGGESPTQLVRFDRDGVVLAMYGQESTATPLGLSVVSARIQVGSRDVFLDGNGGPAFAPFAMLFGGLSNWYPMLVETEKAVPWVVTFRNGIGAAATNSPMVNFAWISNEDLAAMASAERAGR